MKQIADMTNGKFFRAQDTRALEQIFQTIDAMEKTEIKRQTLIETDDLFLWLVAAAFASALAGLTLRHTWLREVPA
jgi:Ca-activated chloride channel family protein